MRHLLEAATFRRRERALAHLATLSRQLPEELQERVASLIRTSPDPDSAVLHLSRLAAEKPVELARIAQDPRLLVPALAVFAHSRFLSDELLEHPDWLARAVLGDDWEVLLTATELERRLEDSLLLQNAGAPSALLLAQFRRQQILRILLRDVTGLATLADTTEELSNLADAILNVAYHHIRDELVKRYGTPRVASENGSPAACEFSVIALGKLGGQELNYSSDIDLMFVYSGNGETDGERSIANSEFFKRLANLYTELLSTYTAEGMCYRVDLRLRPDGKLGEIGLSLDGAKKYYQTRARDWELQMLIKARAAAGDRGPGRDLLEFVEPLIYSSSTDFTAVEAVSATRLRIQEKLQERKGASKEIDVKLAPGGIRDIEFLVQCLQRLHGGREPWLRHGGTMLALFRLRDKNLLSDLESQRLVSAYEFMRHLEHRLQFEDDRQTHVLPQDRDALEVLAQRMPVSEPGSSTSAAQLLEDVREHFQYVAEIYERVIHAQKPLYYSASAAMVEDDEARGWNQKRGVEGLDSNLLRYLDQKAPELAASINRAGIRRSGKALQRYLEWVVPHPDWLEWLDSDTVLTTHLIDVFEHSPHFSEQLMRFPDLLQELRTIRQRPGEDRTIAEAEQLEDANDLRRYFRREMFRIQCESICLRNPVFQTLQRTSTVADMAIQAAYRLSLAEVSLTHGPASPTYQASDQMVVIALGRLGMREFDLGSDADLVFVLPDFAAPELEFWTRVATKLIDRLSAYTREGFMFTVDPRLRPNGREGELVQLEAAYKDYFTTRAEAWEGITYMKARAVAGNVQQATQFLNELQELDWRRYGQSGRSLQQLRHMRLRLEREQAHENPLKAGTGGYYDVDFALMYLRLKGAGIFYPVLNTPERIDVIEKMGHLERSDAAFLRDAATFYRSLDHGLRILTGQPEGSLPKSRLQTDMLTELMSRWTPEHLHDQPIEVELAQIQERTREFFDRLFAS